MSKADELIILTTNLVENYRPRTKSLQRKVMWCCLSTSIGDMKPVRDRIRSWLRSQEKPVTLVKPSNRDELTTIYWAIWHVGKSLKILNEMRHGQDFVDKWHYERDNF